MLFSRGDFSATGQSLAFLVQLNNTLRRPRCLKYSGCMYTNGRRPGQSGAVLLLFYFCPHTFSLLVAGASDSVAPVDSCGQITRCLPPPVHLVKVNCCGVWAISGHCVHPCTTNTTSAGTDQYCVRPERNSQSQACSQ